MKRVIYSSVTISALLTLCLTTQAQKPSTTRELVKTIKAGDQAAATQALASAYDGIPPQGSASWGNIEKGLRAFKTTYPTANPFGTAPRQGQSDLEQQLDQAQKELATSQKDAQQLFDEMAQLGEQHNAAKTQHQKEKAALEAKVQELQSHLGNLQDVERQLEEGREAANTVDVLNNAIQDYEDELEEMRAQLAKEQQRPDHSAELEKLKKENASLLQSLRSLKYDFDQMREEAQESAATVDELNNRIADYEDELKEAEERLKACTAQQPSSKK